MLITVVTIFPEMFPGPLSYSLCGKSLGQLWDLKAVNIRDFAEDKHHTVDDSPYGGGAGMIMKPDVVDRALTAALSAYNGNPKIIFMTAGGSVFTNRVARDLMDGQDGLIILCGRYEGVDQRVVDHWKTHHGMMEVSIGDYILFGGEIPAMVVMDSCLRFLPGIMNNCDSTVHESFEVDLLEYPQYTRPAVWNGVEVPSVLLSGNHKAIDGWRLEQSEIVTRSARPDLWRKRCSDDQV
ncbi:MAG: tRNA (guanosine(37)-N1)-methyltransferase TrmD [Holosporales bacterium]|nr:tRNA (guanosine(37)-N1)-methyltransferase TrmD [Holosporales bacterium]